jgi:hypothetical protein
VPNHGQASPPSFADSSGLWATSRSAILETQRRIFNDRLDSVVTATLMFLTIVILIESERHWWLYVFGKRKPVLNEALSEFSRIPK